MRRYPPQPVITAPGASKKVQPKSNASLMFTIIMGIVLTFGYLVIVARASELQQQINMANRDLVKAQFELMQSKQIFIAKVTDSVALSPATIQPVEFLPTLKQIEQVKGPAMPPLKPSLFDVAIGVNAPDEAPRLFAQVSGQTGATASSQ